MLRSQIQSSIKDAMRAREAVKLEALRFVWSKIKELEIDKKSDLNDDEIQKVLMKEVKSRKEAIEQFREAGRDELVSDEESKLVFLEELLPEMMSESDVGEVVDKIISSGENDFGKVMGQVMGRVKGKADGNLVSKVVREKLS
ncbi:GatB/YqeY domain-containing protein [Patescibacteria group bacterium]